MEASRISSRWFDFEFYKLCAELMDTMDGVFINHVSYKVLPKSTRGSWALYSKAHSWLDGSQAKMEDACNNCSKDLESEKAKRSSQVEASHVRQLCGPEPECKC